VILVDPDGKKIMVVEKKGFLGFGRKMIEYKPGAKYSGDSKFAMQTFESLNYIYNNGADEKGIIQQVVDDKRVVKIFKTNQIFDTGYKRNRIDYNPNESTALANDENKQTGEFQSAALGLFHEIGETWRNWFMPEECKRDSYINPNLPSSKSSGYDAKFDTKNDRYIIENFETPAAKKLQEKGFNEGIRTNHWGFPVRTKSGNPTEIPKE
jgi:hypothetical protein